MIRRLYVDNFRSLVDFTWEPGAETLVLGYNGSGKTSALEVFQILKSLCVGDNRLFTDIQAKNRTFWRRDSTIRIEVDVELGIGLYRYELTFGFKTDGWTDIISERLSLGGRPLFDRHEQRVDLMPVDGMQGTRFPIAVAQSVVATVGSEFGGENIVPFREYFARILYFKPLPTFLSQGHLTETASAPDESLEDLVSWYLNLSRMPTFAESFKADLVDVWPELVSVSTPEYGPGLFGFVLEMERKSSGGLLQQVPFSTLSDGERMLIGLYVIAAYQRTHSPTTIIIDEPDNFVSLLEIEPWLSRMLSDRPDDGQLILVSHNPEIIQTMGRHRVAYFSREDHLSPTKVSSLPPDETGLPLSELLARGWVDA